MWFYNEFVSCGVDDVFMLMVDPTVVVGYFAAII